MFPRPLGKKHPGDTLEVVSLIIKGLIYISIDYNPWAYGDTWLVIRFWDSNCDIGRRVSFRFWTWRENGSNEWES
jgi:hypothetical protein